MFWKNAMKYPALIAGMIMFTIFILDPKTKNWWNKMQGRYIPSTCRALADRVESKAPSEWSIECPSTSRLVLNVDFSETFQNPTQLRSAIYRSMANNLKRFALVANPETLQNLETLEVRMNNDKIQVWGQTDGQAMVKLRGINSQKEMAEHLELTVKVKEKRI